MHDPTRIYILSRRRSRFLLESKLETLVRRSSRLREDGIRRFCSFPSLVCHLPGWHGEIVRFNPRIEWNAGARIALKDTPTPRQSSR